MKKITWPFLLFSLIIILSCEFGSGSSQQKTPEELKLELKTQEQSYPVQYLTLDSVYMNQNKIKDAGIFTSAKYDGYKITGIVKNSATIAKFKDLKITVQIYSKTKTVIDEQTYVFYEYYEPNTEKNFFIKLNPPNAMKSFHAYVTGATPTE